MKVALPGPPLALVLALATIARADGGDDEARGLFVAGDYRAAAAAFEERWAASHDGHDGLNAVIALRSAGAYAHGLALLERVRASSAALPSDVASRVSVLDATLRELTGTVVLEPEVPADATLEIDGAPAWRSGGAIVVDVGKRELSVARPGCDVFRWSGTVRPGQRVAIAVSFACHALPGSIHVTLSGASGARIHIDGRPFATDTYDFDTAEPPGVHRVEVERRGVVLVDETVTVPPEISVSVRARAPWRAKAAGLIAGATVQGIGATNGETGAAGIVLGYQSASVAGGGLDPGPTLELLVMFGAATTGVGEGTGPRFWAGLTAGVSNLIPPLWQRRSGGTSWFLDFDPALATFQAATTSEATFVPGISVYASVTYLGMLPLLLTAELPFAHAELALWPAGVVVHQGFGNALFQGPPATLTHAASLALTIGWKVLGD